MGENNSVKNLIFMNASLEYMFFHEDMFIGRLLIFRSCLVFQKRAELYHLSVKPFLDYFSESDRLVTVDVTSGIADLIWNQVHETMCTLEFHPNRVVNTVMLFIFSKSISDLWDDF